MKGSSSTCRVQHLSQEAEQLEIKFHSSVFSFHTQLLPNNRSISSNSSSSSSSSSPPSLPRAECCKTDHCFPSVSYHHLLLRSSPSLLASCLLLSSYPSSSPSPSSFSPTILFGFCYVKPGALTLIKFHVIIIILLLTSSIFICYISFLRFHNDT